MPVSITSCALFICVSRSSGDKYKPPICGYPSVPRPLISKLTPQFAANVGSLNASHVAEDVSHDFASFNVRGISSGTMCISSCIRPYSDEFGIVDNGLTACFIELDDIGLRSIAGFNGFIIVVRVLYFF
jgi:hypothetical protein